MTFDDYILLLPAPPSPLVEASMREGWIACMRQRDAEKEIARRDTRIKELEERRCEICGYAEHHREHTGCLRVFVNEQAAEISRLKGVLAKCKETLVSSISDLQEPNFATLAAWRIKEALAAIKEEGL